MLQGTCRGSVETNLRILTLSTSQAVHLLRRHAATLSCCPRPLSPGDCLALLGEAQHLVGALGAVVVRPHHLGPPPAQGDGLDMRELSTEAAHHGSKPGQLRILLDLIDPRAAPSPNCGPCCCQRWAQWQLPESAQKARSQAQQAALGAPIYAAASPPCTQA